VAAVAASAVAAARAICSDCGRSFPSRWSDGLCIGCLKRRLVDRIEEVLETLFPGGQYERRQFRVGGLGGEPGRSLSVELAGSRAGLWYDHAAAVGGDLVSLIALADFDGDIGSALRWARTWLKLPAPVPPRRALPQREAAISVAAVQCRVEQSWREAAPLRRGDLVCEYLQGRAIDLEVLAAANNGRLPGSLRCHPRLWCGEAGRHFPAMIGAIVGPDGRLIGIHRTFLEQRSTGVGKAAIEVPKRTLGAYRDGCIRLWRGASRQPWHDAPATDQLAIAEGVEDALSMALTQPAWRVAAAVSVSAMLSIELPQQISKVVLVTQNDPANSPACRVLLRVRARLRAEGKRVWLLKPPRWVKDVNETLQAARDHG
jgi:hypothetical protein